MANFLYCTRRGLTLVDGRREPRLDPIKLDRNVEEEGVDVNQVDAPDAVSERSVLPESLIQSQLENCHEAFDLERGRRKSITTRISAFSV